MLFIFVKYVTGKSKYNQSYQSSFKFSDDNLTDGFLTNNYIKI